MESVGRVHRLTSNSKAGRRPGAPTIPLHKGRDIAPPLLRQIAKDLGLTVEEFSRWRCGSSEPMRRRQDARQRGVISHEMRKRAAEGKQAMRSSLYPKPQSQTPFG
jgi:hypothetical protein